MTQPRVGDLDEEALLAQVFPLLPAGDATLLGPGDDAAVLAAPDGRTVVSTDVLVEDRHFRRAWGTGADLGWRAAMQNLADVAAMGARPTGIVVGLVLPADVKVAWVLDLARGLAAACAPHGAGVVGGDLTSGDAVVVAVTVHGDLEGRAAVLRSGARPGDVLALAGTLGRAAAGHAVLEAGLAGHAELVEAFVRPTCPLEAGPAAARGGASAMMDVSDGLLRDAGRLARASGVLVDVDPGLLGGFVAPLRAAAQATHSDPLTWVLTGGEDHGLLATFPDDGALPSGFVPIGRVEPGEGVRVAGQAWSGRSGWDHFGGSGRQPRR